jgi:broad specificity phosphatase PhoE
VLLVRHSAREQGPVVEGQPDREDLWLLTPQGRIDAREFGTRLPSFSNLFLTHTRIDRTRHTAEEIAAGFREAHPQANVEIEGVDPALGLATFYARDLALRDRWREELGERFYDAWLRGEIPAAVLAPIEEAISDLVERLRLKSERNPESSLQIAVTHDVYVFAMREVLLGTQAEERPRIGFLEGILLAWDPAGHLKARCVDEPVHGGPE